MELNCIGFEQTEMFSKLFLDYINENDQVKPFYNRFPSHSAFLEQLKHKNFTQEQRDLLRNVLEEQYTQVGNSSEVLNNIQSIAAPNTYTVTTGHQLNIFTGPLYFIYKIVSVVNICKQLKKEHPDYNFVPVYWMASEDHDFEEINHFFLEGEKYSWNTDQKGAVGRFSVNGLSELSEKIPGKSKVFYDAYHENDCLADAVRAYVHALFKDQGVVVVDADNRLLKASFKSVMLDDLQNHSAERLVHATTAAIKEAGYKTQVSAREINFFYLDNGIRERIVANENGYEILHTDLRFTEAEMKDIIDNEPEKLSPNVVLRPLYQETILPNLAYIGGPAEMVYWLQFSEMFGHYKVPFPILMPRNFALVVPSYVNRKIKKTGLPTTSFFSNENVLIKDFLVHDEDVDFNLDEQRSEVEQTFEKIKNKAEGIDKSLLQFVDSVLTRANKELDNIESKLIRAEKKKNKTKVGQILSVKEALFPNGTPQERKENMMRFYLSDEKFIDHLVELFDPFNFKFNILTEPDE